MLTPEGRIKKACRKWLREQGAYVFSPVQTGYGAQTLDDLVCWHGIFVGLEYKAGGKKPTARQTETMNQINLAGGTTAVITSVDQLNVIQQIILKKRCWP